MTTFRVMVLGSALLGSAVLPAQAADLYGGGVKDGYGSAPLTGPVKWYARIDGGYAFHGDPSLNEAGRFKLTGSEIGETGTVGGGFGYYFTRYLRADVTWDHRFESDVRGTISAASPLPNAGVAYGLRSDVLLANLYYDFDLGGRFSPYIGAGIGATYNRTSSGSLSDGGLVTGDFGGDGQWSFAGALMAGFTINFGGISGYGSTKDGPGTDIRGRWNLDFGYRFLYLGDARTGDIIGSGASLGTNSGQLALKDMTAHEFRLGLRYDLR